MRRGGPKGTRRPGGFEFGFRSVSKRPVSSERAAVAALATKGSRIHAYAGRTFVGCFFFLCAGGYILEFEYLKHTVVEVFGMEMNVSPFHKRTDTLAVINTTMVNTIALYFAWSGWRIWRRAPLSAQGRYPILDSVLAAGGLVAGGTFFLTLWFAIDSGAVDHHTARSFVWEGHVIIAVATAYVFFDAGKDLWIGIARRPPRAWWRIHARKMIAAQMGLAAACSRWTPRGTCARAPRPPAAVVGGPPPEDGPRAVDARGVVRLPVHGAGRATSLAAAGPAGLHRFDLGRRLALSTAARAGGAIRRPRRCGLRVREIDLRSSATRARTTDPRPNRGTPSRSGNRRDRASFSTYP